MNSTTRAIEIESVEVRRLAQHDIQLLADFYTVVSESGLEKHFHPHEFDRVTAHKISCYQGFDWYAGAIAVQRHGKAMIGYVMLRGWDQGYCIPSLGICVIPGFQGFGLGDLLLQSAISVARLRKSPAIRLKVYPDNEAAIALYRKYGFKFQTRLERAQLVGILELSYAVDT